jgi:hypothetical protein
MQGGEIRHSRFERCENSMELRIERLGPAVHPKEPTLIVGRTEAVEIFSRQARFPETGACRNATGQLGGSATAF